MSRDYRAASRYARSFFQISKEKGREQTVDEDLSRVREFAGTHKEFSRILMTTMISDEEKFELIDNLLEGLASAETRNFIKLLVEKNRFDLFEGVAEKFRELFNADRGIEEATLVTAFPVAPDQAEDLRRALERKLQKKIRLVTEVDPSLIGGAVVYTANQVIDGSLKEKLKGLRQSLLSIGSFQEVK